MKSMRDVYQETLRDLMKSDKKVVMLDADLASASGSSKTFLDYPNQTVNVGISEANMMSSAAGLRLTGMKPFVHTFAPFATRRVYDQLYMSVAYSKNPIHIYGSDPGFWAQHNGGTHTSFEDLSLMLSLPRFIVTAPSTPKQFTWVLNQYYQDNEHPYYTRAQRKEMPELYNEETEFELGKGIKLTQGKDVLIFAIGDSVHESLKVEQRLREEGLTTTVVDMFSLKPFDRAMIVKEAAQHRLVVAVENHHIHGGLGSIVAKVLAEEAIAVPLLSIGIEDHFGEVGQADYLREKFGLDDKSIYKKITKKTKEIL